MNKDAFLSKVLLSISIKNTKTKRMISLIPHNLFKIEENNRYEGINIIEF